MLIKNEQITSVYNHEEKNPIDTFEYVYWLLHTTCYVCGVNACSYLGSSVTLTLFLATRYLN